MKSIAFVSFERHYYDRHQFYCLAAYLKSKGFEVSYISGTRFDQVAERLRTIRPDLLGYSTFSANAETYIAFDAFQKGHLGIKSIIGGPGAIFAPSTFSKSTIDAVCIGEGEEALAQYLESDGMDAGNVVTTKAPVKPVKLNNLAELGSLPFPDRSLVYSEEAYLKNMKYRMFLSGRGCPFQCTYCHNNIFNKRFAQCGKIVRKKPVDYFIEEIGEVDSAYNPRLIVMQDDTFIIDRTWLSEFSGKYKRRIGKPFACNIRANLMDEEIVRYLKDAGCVCCVWSIETGNDNLRNTVLKRNMTAKQIIDTADLLNKYGIRHRIGNIIGIPHETYREVQETIELNIRCRPHLAIANTLVPYPNLEIADYAIRAGCLDPASLDNIPDVFISKSILNFPEGEKVKLLKTTYLFPLFVKFPVLYKNNILRNALYRLPNLFLKYIHAVTDIYGMATLYRFGATLDDIFNIIVRYLRYSVEKTRPAKAVKNKLGGI